MPAQRRTVALYLASELAEVHPRARVGGGTRIWNGAQVREDARIGSDCVIGKGAYIDSGVVVGNRCKIQNYACIYRDALLEDGVFVGPHAVLTNDRQPRAVNSDGSLLYVADTWNQRMQLFQGNATTGIYTATREWPIVGWYGQSLENKPYVALDAQGRVYVTDPEGYRVLVFDRDGVFLTMWGDYGTDNSAFGLASGMAVDKSGNIYVTDAGNHRLMKFPAIK